MNEEFYKMPEPYTPSCTRDTSVPPAYVPGITSSPASQIYVCMNCGKMYSHTPTLIAGALCQCDPKLRAAVYHGPAFGGGAEKELADLRRRLGYLVEEWRKDPVHATCAQALAQVLQLSL
jgi:hypothetical protein